MHLNDRKLKILEAIISEYIVNAEPIGSRTISKKHSLGVSPATIRNEMSDLEEMGYLVQPHTSSGRVPSQVGYELYVQMLMGKLDLKQAQKDMIDEVFSGVKPSELIEKVLMLLSELTNCISVAAIPNKQTYKIKNLHLVHVNINTVLAVIVTENHQLKEIILKVKKDISQENLNLISQVLNENLAGNYISNMDAEFEAYLKNRISEYSDLLDNLLLNFRANSKKRDVFDLFLEGKTNILDFPEFNDIIKAKEFFNMLKEKDFVLEMINKDGIKKDEINIAIGSVNTNDITKDCSIITATCFLGQETIGKIGIIGPLRMDYSKVCSVIDYITRMLNDKIRKD